MQKLSIITYDMLVSVFADTLIFLILYCIDDVSIAAATHQKEDKHPTGETTRF